MQARWALELTRRKFRLCDFTAVFSEPWLRWKLGDWKGRITLPVLLPLWRCAETFSSEAQPLRQACLEAGVSAGALRDSYHIALWGNENRAKDADDLFPEAHKDTIRECGLCVLQTAVLHLFTS